MTSFADLRTRMADGLDRSDLGSQIGDHIKRAIKHYERTRFWFNEAQATSATVASQASYSMPSDLLVLDYLEATISSRRMLMTEITWARYLDNYRYLTTTGQPQEWAYYADQLWLGPIPNGVYTLTLHYIKKLTELSADADSNAWTDRAEDLIVFRAYATLGREVIGLPTEKILGYEAMSAQALAKVNGENDQRVMTGLARPWSG